MAEAKEAASAALEFPEGSEGREVLGILSRAAGRMGTQFERAGQWGGSRYRLLNSIRLDLSIFAYGEDPGDRHTEADKRFARQQLLVARLALRRLDAAGQVGHS